MPRAPVLRSNHPERPSQQVFDLPMIEAPVSGYETNHAVRKTELPHRLAELEDRPAQCVQPKSLDAKRARQDGVRHDLARPTDDRAQKPARTNSGPDARRNRRPVIAAVAVLDLRTSQRLYYEPVPGDLPYHIARW